MLSNVVSAHEVLRSRDSRTAPPGAPGASSEVPEGPWAMFNFQRKHSNTSEDTEGSTDSRSFIVSTLDSASFLLMTSFLCEAGAVAVPLIKSKLQQNQCRTGSEVGGPI